jgi:hypothetical protein
LPKDQWRPADSIGYQVDRNLDTVSNLDEGYPAVHPVAVVLPVKRHCAFNLTVSCSFTGKGQIQRFVLRDSANGKSSIYLSGVGARLYNLGGVKGDHRVLVGLEEILALQLSVLHAASGFHADCLNFNV